LVTVLVQMNEVFVVVTVVTWVVVTVTFVVVVTHEVYVEVT